jgi:hypothetical protein
VLHAARHARRNGFVVNLEYERPGLEERVRGFAEEVRLPVEQRCRSPFGIVDSR